MQKIIQVTFFLILFTHGLKGQIVDDTTELVYSAATTKILFERDLKYNKQIERHPDTTLYQIENFEVMDEQAHYYQDLGNNGTAMWSIFYDLNNVIGRTSGFNSFNIYERNSKNIAFFDTKSPFIDLEVAFGGQGRSNVELGFSRNVNANWNIGFGIYRITSDKQIATLSEGDRNIIGANYDLYTFYKHPKQPYKIVASVSQMDFDIAETGGILVDNEATNEDLFEYQDSEVRLNDATAEEKRVSWHVYQEYLWTKPLQFYHQFDFKTQKVRFQDFTDGAGGAEYDTYDDYYQNFYFDEDSTYSLSEWREVNNEIGIKGQLSSLFYSAYVKHRFVDQDFLYNDPTVGVNEFYVGGYTRFDWKDKFNVSGNVEFLQSGEYYFDAKIESELIFGSYTSKRQIPNFLQQSYFTNHRNWETNFNSSFSNEIKGGIKLKYKNMVFRPQMRLLSQDQFIYFNEDAIPQQSTGIGLLSSFGGDVDIKLFTNRKFNEAFHFENEIYFSALSGEESDKLRVPNVFYNGRFFWRGLWFKNTMGVEVGLDLHAKSSYFAMAYVPDIQQFGLQDDFEIQSFFTADLFFSMKVNSFRAFVKVTHLNQQAAGGYFITPYYPGLPRVVDIGFKWMFFD